MDRCPVGLVRLFGQIFVVEDILDRKAAEYIEHSPSAARRAAEFQEIIAGKNLQVKNDLRRVSVTMNEDLNDILLNNLISNAIKFSDENKTIRIRTFVNNGKVEIAIKDEGIGIGEDDQEHLFDSFFRAANATNIQGTGLGLHIVKRYADLLGGSVDLKSTLDVGTTITIVIPSNQQ